MTGDLFPRLKVWSSASVLNNLTELVEPNIAVGSAPNNLRFAMKSQNVASA